MFWDKLVHPNGLQGPTNSFEQNGFPCIPTTKSFYHKSVFFGTPKFTPKRPQAKMLTWGSPNPIRAPPNPPPGMKKQKMRAEKPCRTPPSKNQTEPYSASYGRKPFWGVPLKILVYARGDLGATSPNPGISKGNLGNLKAIWALSEWYLGASWSSWVPGVAK